jgi:hypothetical protein
MGDREENEDGNGRDWQFVEVPELPGAGFRFRPASRGGMEVEVLHEKSEDEVPATWFARGWVECYVDMMGTMQKLLEGGGRNPD